MRYLFEQCASWPLFQELVAVDVQAWPRERERRAAVERTIKRTIAVAPSVLEKGTGWNAALA